MYESQNFENLIGTDGFSQQLLKNHFGLYDGYVANTNALMEQLKTMEKGTPQFAELRRRFGWEWNGMRLHELYFGNLTKEPQGTFDADSVLGKKIAAHFGSIDLWQEDFLATGAMRGIGWVILAYDVEGDEMFNLWIGEHDLGHLAGATPLLVMDVFEHAFVLDYGTDRASYLGAFINAIDWNVVNTRFSQKD